MKAFGEACSTAKTLTVGLKGHIGLQIHPGKELLIRFKDIQVRE
jgi:hypothetical protein